MTRILLAALPALLLVACVSSPGDPAGPRASDAGPPAPLGWGSGPAIGVPPTLGPEEHPGWGNPRCEACHTLPVPGHTVTETFVCAQCHGANGACFTNGWNDLYNEHTPEDDCGSCHMDSDTPGAVQHGFEDGTVCANCHFRELGQRACEDYVPPDVTGGPIPDPGESPTLSSALRSGCFMFPTRPFSERNAVPAGREWATTLGPGDQAVEVTLADVEGTEHTLSELLAWRPVWLQTGSYTCPVYQNAVRNGLNPLAADANADGPYRDQIAFVHVYTVEAHPAPPDFSPYGSTRVLAYSTLAQPTTYAERLANALVMEPSVEGELMLLDTLAPDDSSNAVWCTYGTCPACSFLIGRDGVIHEVIERTPDDPDELRTILDAFLASQSP